MTKPKQYREAARLDAIYKRKKKELGLTQERLAALMGFSTQSSVSQYLTGKIPLSDAALLKFAYHLQFNPVEVRPEIFDQFPITSSPDLASDAVAFARQFQRLSKEDQAILMALAEKLGKGKREG